MEGSAKIKLSTFLLSNAYGSGSWVVYEASLELILAFNWPSEASWKADVIKYDFREGPKSFATPPPREIFGFWLQWEGPGRVNKPHTLLPLRLKPTGRRIGGQYGRGNVCIRLVK